MHRLAQLTPQQRTRIGVGLLTVGTLLLAVGVLVVHAALRSSTADLGLLEVVPRGWFPKAIGYLIGFGASQALLAGAALIWVLGRPMTWARATFAAFLAWIELVLIFGVVPSEWLNLAQTDLNWSPQRVAVTIPPALVLGNEVAISFAAIKDAISGTYNLVMLVAVAVFAYQVQDLGKPQKPVAAPEPPRSPYGRPLLRGGE